MGKLLKQRHKPFMKTITGIVLAAFCLTSVPSYALAQSLTPMPVPGQAVALTPAFAPLLIKGLCVDPADPFKFNFIVDVGDEKLEGQAFNEEATRLIKYFLASLTIPEKDLWVNLSPFEKDRIVPEGFGATDMGRDLLAQDYLLKQLTASLTSPETAVGKEFWDKVYKAAYEKFGTTQVPTDTFNKVWIVPDKAKVYENGDKAFVVESKLKVMLEQDYLAQQVHSSELVAHSKTNELSTKSHELTSRIMREVVIPELEKEVNDGKSFATLRQVYHSFILATWFKQTLKESILNKKYSDQGKTDGIVIANKNEANEIYTRYLEAYKKGVCNMIKVERDPVTNKNIPRKYFSGGMVMSSSLSGTGDLLTTTNNYDEVGKVVSSSKNLRDVSASLNSSSSSASPIVSAIIDEAIKLYPPSTLNQCVKASRWIEERLKEQGIKFEERTIYPLHNYQDKESGTISHTIIEAVIDGEVKVIDTQILQFKEKRNYPLADKFVKQHIYSPKEYYLTIKAYKMGSIYGDSIERPQIDELGNIIPDDEKTISEIENATKISLGLGGWMASPEYVPWLNKTKDVIRKANGAEELIKAYYYAIGGGGGEKIDIVSCLLATDFDELLAYDKAKRFVTTRQKIIDDLSKVGLKEEDIRITYEGEDDVRVEFDYLGRKRLVKLTYSKDATAEYPAAIKSGYHVLYSRGWPLGFSKAMSEAFKSELLNYLISGKGFVVLENSPSASREIGGFEKIDLGDTSWAGEVRRLDVFLKNAQAKTPDQLNAMAAQVLKTYPSTKDSSYCEQASAEIAKRLKERNIPYFERAVYIPFTEAPEVATLHEIVEANVDGKIYVVDTQLEQFQDQLGLAKEFVERRVYPADEYYRTFTAYETSVISNDVLIAGPELKSEVPSATVGQPNIRMVNMTAQEWGMFAESEGMELLGSFEERLTVGKKPIAASINNCLCVLFPEKKIGFHFTDKSYLMADFKKGKDRKEYYLKKLFEGLEEERAVIVVNNVAGADVTVGDVKKVLQRSVMIDENKGEDYRHVVLYPDGRILVVDEKEDERINGRLLLDKVKEDRRLSREGKLGMPYKSRGSSSLAVIPAEIKDWVAAAALKYKPVDLQQCKMASDYILDLSGYDRGNRQYLMFSKSIYVPADGRPESPRHQHVFVSAEINGIKYILDTQLLQFKLPLAPEFIKKYIYTEKEYYDNVLAYDSPQGGKRITAASPIGQLTTAQVKEIIDAVFNQAQLGRAFSSEHPYTSGARNKKSALSSFRKKATPSAQQKKIQDFLGSEAYWYPRLEKLNSGFLAEIWKPHFEQLMNEMKLSPQEFIEKAKNRSLSGHRKIIQWIREPIKYTRITSGQIGKYTVTTDQKAIVANVQEYILSLAQKGDRQLTVTLAGTLASEVAAVMSTLDKALRNAAQKLNVPATDIDAWIATWKVKVKAISIETLSLLEISDDLEEKKIPRGEWVSPEYMDLLDRSQWPRFLSEPSDIFIVANSLYLGEWMYSPEHDYDDNKELKLEFIQKMKDFVKPGGIAVTEIPIDRGRNVHNWEDVPSLPGFTEVYGDNGLGAIKGRSGVYVKNVSSPIGKDEGGAGAESVRQELTREEKRITTKLYLRLVDGEITPEEYYREFQKTVDPRALVIQAFRIEENERFNRPEVFNIGKNIVSEFEKASQELGVDLVPLLVEPGIFSRTDEFLTFAREKIKEGKFTANQLRDAFADSLGYATVYRGLRLVTSPSRKLALIAPAARQLQESPEVLEYLEIGRDDAGKLRKYIRKVANLDDSYPLDKVIEEFDASLGKLNSAYRDVALRAAYGDKSESLCQSVTEIKQLALDIDMGKHKSVLSEGKVHVFEIKIPKIYLLQWNKKYFPYAGTPGLKIRTSDGKEYEMDNDVRVESFVQVPIRPEWIESITPYDDTEKTFTFIPQEKNSSSSVVFGAGAKKIGSPIGVNILNFSDLTSKGYAIYEAGSVKLVLVLRKFQRDERVETKREIFYFIDAIDMATGKPVAYMDFIEDSNKKEADIDIRLSFLHVPDFEKMTDGIMENIKEEFGGQFGAPLEDIESFRNSGEPGGNALFIKDEYRSKGPKGLWNLDKLMTEIAFSVAEADGMEKFVRHPRKERIKYHEEVYGAQGREDGSVIIDLKNRKAVEEAKSVTGSDGTVTILVQDGPQSSPLGKDEGAASSVGNDDRQTWEDVQKYRASLEEKGIGIDPFIKEIWRFNKHAYWATKKSTRFLATTFPSARDRLGIEKKWNLPTGLTELDIQQLIDQNHLGSLHAVFSGRKYRQIIAKLWEALKELNPELKRFTYVDYDIKSDPVRFSPMTSNVMNGISSRYNADDIEFFINYWADRKLPEGYEEREKQLNERLGTSFDFFISPKTLDKVEEKAGFSDIKISGRKDDGAAEEEDIFEPAKQAEFYDSFKGKPFIQKGDGRIVLSMTTEDPELLKAVADMIKKKVPRNKAVLEVGAGQGHLVEALINQGLRDITAVDIGGENVLAAQARVKAAIEGKAEKPKVDIRQGNAYDLKFNKNSFDVVILNESVGGLRDMKKVFSEAARVLRRGGLIIVTTYNKDKESVIQDARETHYLSHSTEAIKDALAKSGFENITDEDILSEKAQGTLSFFTATKRVSSNALDQTGAAGADSKISKNYLEARQSPEKFLNKIEQVLNEKFDKQYDIVAQAGGETSAWNRPQRAMQEEIKIAVDGRDPSDVAILDLGCGDGSGGSIDLAREGFNVTAVDLSKTAMNLFEKRLINERLEKQVNLKQGDILHVLKDLNSDTFDVVHAHLSLQYSSKGKLIEILKEIRRVLKSGGKFLFKVHSLEDTRMSVKDEWVRLEPNEEFYIMPNGEITRFFSKEFIEKLFEQEVGFEKVSLGQVDVEGWHNKPWVGVYGKPVSSSVSPTGGIDLNAENFELERENVGQGVRFDATNFENVEINGLTPVILNVTPVTNLQLLLGAANAEEPAEVSS